MDKYDLQISITLSRLDKNGFHTPERMTVNENVALEIDGFLETCAVLAQFHKLVDTIKASRAPKTETT